MNKVKVGDIIIAKQYDGNGVSCISSKVALVLPLISSDSERKIFGASYQISGNNLCSSKYLLWFFNQDYTWDSFRTSCENGVEKVLTQSNLDVNSVLSILKSQDKDSINFLKETLKAELKSNKDKENNRKQTLKI